MRIAYLNKDEVNREIVARIAARFGAVICNLGNGDARSDIGAEAVLYNLDDMPRDLRPAVLQGLTRSTQDLAVGVHGYDLRDDEIAALRGNGVAASQRLDSDLVRNLWKAILRRRSVVLPSDTTTDLTWVNLVK
jgi:hypothetical protein